MNTVLRSLCLVLLLSSMFAACTDLAVIPADAQLVCASDDDCPDGFACRLALGRCLDNARAQAAPIAVVTATTVVHQRRSQQAGFSLVETSASFSTAPVAVGGLLDDTTAFACTVDPDHVVHCALDLADVADLVDGEHDVTVFADDGLGTIASSRARVTVDLVAPDVVADAVVVTYLPNEDNALEATSAVGPTSDAAVQLSLTEVLGAAPVATAAGAPTALAFAPAVPTGLVATLIVDGTAFGAVDDGAIDVSVELTDDVGNTRTVVLPAVLTVDHTAPPPAAVDVRDAVVYERIPEGNRATAGVAQFTLTIAGGVEANAVVVVTTSADFNSTTLGDAEADDTGSAVIDLAPVDLPSVFVHVVDAAGNVSASARVQDIVWTASLGGRVAGDPRSNPHALFSSTNFDGVSLTPHLQSEVATASELVRGGAVDVVASGAFVQDFVLGANTPATALASVVWHAADGELLAVGGVNASGFGFSPRVLRLEGERWVVVDVVGEQPPSVAGVTVYDPIRERLVFVQDEGETWALAGGRWRQVAADGFTPASGAAVAWDEQRRGIVRFGGRVLNGTERLNETWFFDGAAWEQLEFPTSPPARDVAAMAFDRVDHCLVLRGGESAGANILGDLWRLDETGWHEVAGINAPYARGVAVTVPDGGAEPLPNSGRVQFVGGAIASQTFSPGLVTFDGERLLSGVALRGATHAGAAFDLAQQQLVVLGGFSFNLGLNLVPHFVVVKDDVVREPPETRTSLGAGDNAAIAFDATSGNVVLFGGQSRFGASTLVLNTTRRWDGTTSLPVNAPSDQLPFGGIFFDGASIGGINATAVVSFTGTAWDEAGTPPTGAPTFATAFAYHAGDDVAFGFGGNNNSVDRTDATITVRDGVLTVLSPVHSPPARTRAQAVYDVRNDRIVLYGGSGSVLLRDTWVYENDDWRELDTTVPEVGEARLVYDENRDIVVRLSAGRDGKSLRVDELRDDRWQQRDVAVPGEPRTEFNAVWDGARGRVFVQGGVVGGRSTNDVFTWDGDVRTTPAVLMAVDLRARETRATSVRAIDIVATAGATGADPDGAALDGIDVLVWGDGWEHAGGGGASASAAAQTSVHLDDATQLRRIAKSRVVVAVRSAAPSGGGPAAALHVEALEVTVRYRED